LPAATDMKCIEDDCDCKCSRMHTALVGFPKGRSPATCSRSASAGKVREQRASTCRSRPSELLSCTCSPSSSSTLAADLARCEASKLCSVEPPRSTPVGAGARQRSSTPQSAAAPRSRATCRRPRTRSCTGLARGSYSSIALTRCRCPAEHHAQIKLSRTARRRAPARCSDVEAKGGGEICESHQQCWSRRWASRRGGAAAAHEEVDD
jgi:hypothetical protein